MYGNSGGKNKGKKYKKLTGEETATPLSSKKARAFMLWYGRNYHRLRAKLPGGWNDEVATDTALKIYEGIELKGLLLSSYKQYYFRAYYTNIMRHKRDEMQNSLISGPLSIDENAGKTAILAAPAQYDETAEHDRRALSAEIMDYVRANFTPYESSIFEIYIGLQPNTSCRAVSVMLGLSPDQVWRVVEMVRKAIGPIYKSAKDNMLSP